MIKILPRRRYKLKSAKPSRIKKRLPKLFVFIAKCLIALLPIAALPLFLIALPFVGLGMFFVALALAMLQVLSEVNL